MKHVHYDSSTILTSDDVADAVIEYAGALAGGDRADTVDVPAVAEDGTMTTTKILIGRPARSSSRTPTRTNSKSKTESSSHDYVLPPKPSATTN